MDRSELLVQHGFIKGSAKGNYTFNKKTNKFVPIPGMKLKKSDAHEEVTEIAFNYYGKTGFPIPTKSYKLVWVVYDMTIEEPYFWIINTMKEYFPIIEKLEDSFSAAENSSLFGISQQRLGGQQDKVSQFLATTGKMIKELFQMVRELRIIDERLIYYKGSDAQLKKNIAERKKGDEITLKGMFVDLVQGGGKSAASIYGMAQQLEFITLPDLFFDAPPFKDTDELDVYVKNMSKDFNENVLRVLLRHLNQFTVWKKRTFKEHKDRRRFMLRYLKQHFDIIQMYITWIKPYLRHVEKLTMKEENLNSVDIVSAFEGSMIDLEVMARKRTPVGNSGANGCILATFNYRTRPDMKFVQEGYQRGPVHTGLLEMNLRVYFWSDEQLKNYKDLKRAESLELIGNVSGSVREAMKALGDELDHYIKEAEKNDGSEDEEATEVEKSLMEKLLGDFYTPKKKKASTGPTAKELKAQQEGIKKAFKGLNKPLVLGCWNTYKNFKKAHRMVQW